MKRNFSTICLMLLCCLSIITPGCRVETPPPPPEPVTLRVAAPYGVGRAAAYFAPLVSRFNERYPHITVEITSPAPEYPEKDCAYNPENCVSYQNVDVFSFYAFQGYDLWQRGLLLDLNDFDAKAVQHDPQDFLPGVLEAFTVEGRQIGIPVGLHFTALYYNLDLFDHARVPYPTPEWTWAEFLAAAQALTDRENGVFGVAPGNWYLWVQANGGASFDYTASPPRPTLNDPRLIEALEWYTALRDVHHVMPTDAEVQEHLMRSSDLHAVIEWGAHNGQIALWPEMVMGAGVRRSQRPLWPERTALALLPSNGERITRVTLYGQGVSATTTHPEAAWQWVTFLAQQPPLSDTFLMPVRRSVLTAQAYIEAQGQDTVDAVLAALTGATDFGLCGAYCEATPEMIEASRSFMGAVQAVLSGERSAADALNAAQQQVE
ncbi:MAG TPA: extracellular solute-binding protein [Anaerolineae bacterium]|nr:extracellular solute-binding protein [Anaerolineae bacterium]